MSVYGEISDFGQSGLNKTANAAQVINCSERFLSEQACMHQPRTVAYLRVSTKEQSIDRQAYGLRDLCDEFHVERLSAGARRRPVFEHTIASLRPGDTFLIWDLDRAFRSTIDALVTADLLEKRGVQLRIAQMHINAATEEGELFYTMVAAYARFERRILARRTREGLAAARANGKRLGRPPLINAETARLAHEDITQHGYPCRYVAHLLGVSRITLQRAIHREGLEYPNSKPTKGKKNDPIIL